MTITTRLQEPTPKFFVKIRTIGVTLAAISAAILAIPAPLPAIVITWAGYLAVAGTVAGAVSQAAVKNEKQ